MSEEPSDADGVDGDADTGTADDAAATEQPTAEPTPPTTVLKAGLTPLLDLGRQGAAAVGVPEPTTLASDVRSLPPHERFRESAPTYANRFGMGGLTDPESLDGLAADLPVDAPVQVAVETIVRNAGKWQGQLLAQLLVDPDDPGQYLACVVLLERLERAAAAAKTARETETGDFAHSLSTVLALVARLVALTEDDATVDDAVYRDALLASYHIEVAAGVTPANDPTEKSADEMHRIVHLQGALLAADTFDAPADEVAAVTGVPVAHLLTALDRRDGD
ncbi:hypothetical protein [Haloarchaeobius sp. DFWS5]|uniref:hypothetical protein n=1 Tax=Haloarchaeobius sp. DFWS5 TaxID=3446114 RepID=UPI003EBCD481